MSKSFLLFSILATLAASQCSYGRAECFVILAATEISNTGPTIVSAGNMGISPGARSEISGFGPGLVLPPFTIVGPQAETINAHIDATAVFNCFANLPSVPADNLSGMDLGTIGTLIPSVYTFDTQAELTGTLILDGQGNPNAVFVFQIGTSLITGTAAQVVLSNGAQASNVHWQVGSSATLGTSSQFQGNIVAGISITLVSSTSQNGKLLARNGAVVLDTNVVNNAVDDPSLCSGILPVLQFPQE